MTGARPPARPPVEPGDLPEILEQVALATSVGVALTLANRLGGRTVWIRAEPAEGDALTGAVGLNAARVITEALGPGKHLIPMAKATSRAERNARIRAARAAGVTVGELVRQHGIHERTVWRAQSAAPAPLPLFDDDNNQGGQPPANRKKG